MLLEHQDAEKETNSTLKEIDISDILDKQREEQVYISLL